MPAARSSSFARTDVTLVDAAVAPFDGVAGMPPGIGRNAVALPMPADCDEWYESYATVVEDGALPVDVAVLLLGYAPLVDRQVAGRWIGPCETLSWYIDDLGARVAYLRAHVDRVVLAVPSWGGSKASFLSSEDHLTRMGCIRAGLTAYATRADLDTVDLATLLCPSGPQGQCDQLREHDGVHVDPDDAPMVLEWLLDHVV